MTTSIILLLALVGAAYGVKSSGALNRIEPSISPSPSVKPREKTGGSGTKRSNNERSKIVDAQHAIRDYLRELKGDSTPDTPTQPEALRIKGGIEVLIAFVPDPVQTNLALMFDRALESVQRAAADMGYTFDRYWLPWTRPAAVALPDDATAPNSSDEPGLLMYRTIDKRPLVIILVGETPTGGPTRQPLQKAIAIAKAALPAGKSEIRILGPTFSGSLEKLAELKSLSFRMISGSVTDADAVERFCVTSGQSFKTTVHTDQTARQHFLTHFKRTTGALRVALLSEDETVFGASTTPTPPGVQLVRMRFPREISRLRNAYQDQLTTTRPDTLTWNQWRHLQMNYADNIRRQDSVPSLSELQSPLSQEAALATLSTHLRRHRIQLVEIAATDPLDMLFLSRFLRATAPDVRQYILDADLLLVRPSENAWGLISVSTYPLAVRSQDWTRPPHQQSPPRTAVFPSRIAEATYNACKALLTDEKRDPELVDYSHPDHKQPTGPALWISVLGATGYWPIAALYAPDQRLLTLSQPRQELTIRSAIPELPSHAWTVVSSLLGVTLLSLSMLVWLLNGNGAYHDAWPGGRHLCFRDARLVTTDRMFYVVTVAIALLLCNLLLYAPILALWWQRDPVGGNAAFLLLGALSTLAVPIALFAALRHASRRDWIRLGSAILGLLLLSGFLLRSLSVPVSTTTFGTFLTSYRSLQLVSGASPLLPVLLLLLTIPFWAVIHLRRLRFIVDRKYVPPALNGIYVRDLPTIQRSLDAALEQPVFSYSLLGATLGIGFALVAPLRPLDHLQTLELRWFNFGYAVLLSLVVCTVLGVLVRFVYAWRYLRRFLERLELHPIRHAITDLPRDHSWSPLWQRGGLRKRNVLTTRSVETYQRLETLWHKRPDHHRFEWRVHQAMLTPAAKGPDGMYHRAEDPLGETAQLLADRLGEQMWQQGVSESFDRLSATKGPVSVWPEDLRREHQESLVASEFVALRFVHYIRYALVQLRNLMTYLPVAFILIVFSLNSYSFQSRALITWTLAAGFIALGAVVVTILAQMERDAVLSRITETEPGALSGSFFFRVASYGVGPFVALLASAFPAIGQFLTTFLDGISKTAR